MAKFLAVATLLLLIILPLAPARTQNGFKLADLKAEAISEVDKLQTLTQQMVDQIFSFGELGFQEFETSKYVTGILEKEGFKVERRVAGMPTAWVATYGSGKPVIAFITDIDCIPRASQKPGVAYHDPLVEGAPGHGEGHNSGQAVNVTAAIVLKKLMEKYKVAGTIKLLPGVAEELVGAKAFFIRAGLFGRGPRAQLSVSDDLTTSYGRCNNRDWCPCSAAFTARQLIARRHGPAGARWMQSS
jgi:aminobenzoyl-glutamate utilization protein B